MKISRISTLAAIAVTGVFMSSTPAIAADGSSSSVSGSALSPEAAQERSEKLMNETLERNGHSKTTVEADAFDAQSADYPSPGGFGEGVNCVLDVGPIDCLTARNDATTAASEAQALYPTSLSDGAGDSFRHCYWNALMTIHIGSGQAKEVADNHEESATGTAASAEMDFFNNQVGRDIAASSANEGAALSGCAAATLDGRLRTTP